MSLRNLLIFEITDLAFSVFRPLGWYWMSDWLNTIFRFLWEGEGLIRVWTLMEHVKGFALITHGMLGNFLGYPLSYVVHL